VQPGHVYHQAALPVHHQLQQVVVQGHNQVLENNQPLKRREELPQRTEVPIGNLSEKPILVEKKLEGDVKKECSECNNGSESDEESESGSDSEISSDLEMDSDSESDSDRESLSKLKAVALSIAEKNYHKQICEDFVIAIQLEEVLEDEITTIPKTTTTTDDEWNDDWNHQNNQQKYDQKEWTCQLQISKEDIISLYQIGEDVTGLVNVYLGEHPEEADTFSKLLEDAVSSYSIMFNVKTYTPKKPDPEDDIFEIDYLDSYDSEDFLSDDDEYTDLDMNYVDEQELVSVNT